MEQQGSQLLPEVLASLQADQHTSILHLGPIQPETVEFLSQFRCTLYVNDLFSDLPLPVDEDGPDVHQQMSQLLDFPPEARFDVCLFWDLFNYLAPEAISALAQLLRPRLAAGARAHCFGVHNTRSLEQHWKFAMLSPSLLQLRARSTPVPGYAPQSQGKLKELLECLEVQRSVLLAQSRLELSWRVKAQR